MELGAFSISLTVKDLNKSKEFYEKLGFNVFAGEMDHNYLIMKNDNTIIGLFCGMFDKNILTFNPGWNQSCETLKDFQDVRDIKKELESKQIPIEASKIETSAGPAHIVVIDPDGNQILIDQHV